MRYRLKFRQRIFITYPLLGLLLSVVVTVCFNVSFNLLERQYMDYFLLEELEHFIEFSQTNPQITEQHSRTWQIFKVNAEHPPESLRFLSAYIPGTYDINYQGSLYDVGIIERNGIRYYMLFHDQEYESLEASLIVFLAALTFLIIWAATTYGLWLSKRVMKPVMSLAEDVRSLELDTSKTIPIENYASDELGFLAEEFNQYHLRINKLIEREREFSANASHELRTPLAVIKTAAEAMLLRQNLPSDFNTRLTRIVRAADNMTQLLQVLLMLARGPDQHQQENENTDLCKLLSQLLEDFDTLRAPDVTVIKHFSAKPMLPVPNATLSIVLSNLLINAFNNTHQGAITIDVNARQLQIADTGRGIPSEHLQHVMKRGYQAHKSKGRGLGLSLVQQICDFYQWELTIDSPSRSGTTVTLSFAQ